MQENQQHIILFDGVCNLCDGGVQFMIKNDKRKIFKFTSLQSEIGQQLLKQNNLPTEHFNSFVYLRKNKVLLESTAGLYILKDLKRWWQIAFIFIIIPPFIRNTIYRFIAKNRYRWFGKKEACMIPTPELRERFL